ncbi:MAG: MOSC domain-containing protein [Pseudomonadota bacterium]
MSEAYALANLLTRHAQVGRVKWIGLRPARKAPLTTMDAAEIDESGLVGDRHPSPGKRAVTLIQAEHLPVVAALIGVEAVDPADLRRNIVVSGINLTALRKAAIRIGSATLRITGPCAPCSRMERTLGHGGYNAMRGHGGWCAEVVAPGRIALGDAVAPSID